MISTPCINTCTIDTESDQCFGCGRSRDEIALWASITEPERKAIMADLPERVKILEAKLKAQLAETPLKENI